MYYHIVPDMLGIYVCSISLILKHISKYLDLLFENHLLLKVFQAFGKILVISFLVRDSLPREIFRLSNMIGPFQIWYLESWRALLTCDYSMIKIISQAVGKEERITRKEWYENWANILFSLLIWNLWLGIPDFEVLYFIVFFLQYELPFYYPGQVSFLFIPF